MKYYLGLSSRWSIRLTSGGIWSWMRLFRCQRSVFCV